MDYEKIDKALKNSGITQTEFLKKIGLTRAGYVKALKNRSLKVSTLQKISEALNMPISHFFPGFEARPETLKEMSQLEQKNRELSETLQTVKAKLKNIYDAYFAFLLNLTEEDTRFLYKNNKLHSFEIKFLAEAQEAFIWLAESHEEREQHEILSEILKVRTINSPSASNKICVFGDSKHLKAIIQKKGTKLNRLLKEQKEPKK